ncbi:hypothetical protein ACVXG9_24285 [Escherichia coli]
MTTGPVPRIPQPDHRATPWLLPGRQIFAIHTALILHVSSIDNDAVSEFLFHHLSIRAST